LKEAAKSEKNCERIFMQFIDCLKNDAKDTWKIAFLQALGDEGLLINVQCKS